MKKIFVKIQQKIEQVPEGISLVDSRFFVFCNYMFVYALIGHTIFLSIYYSLGYKTVLMIDLMCVIVDLLCLVLNRKGFNKLASFIWFLAITYHSIYSSLVFGWDSGFSIYLFTLVIIVSFTRWHLVLRIIGAIFLCTVTIFIFLYLQGDPAITRLDSDTLAFVFASNTIANFIAIAYACFYYRRYSELMEAQLIKLANTDELTGVFNRRSFVKSVENELIVHSTDRKECALLTFDLDHFKQINDTYGHAIGDIALQKVAEVCKQSLRCFDILGRIGGEEFAIFLVDVNFKEAVKMAEQLRQNIEDIELFNTDGIAVHLSASFGMTVPHSKDEQLSEMMIRSDFALYKAKNEGRNKLVAV